MGATDFYVTVIGDFKTIEEAYRQAVVEAIEQYGADPYNGTISTTSGVKDLTSLAPKSAKGIQKFIEESVSDEKFGLSKRGMCGCIEFKEGKVKKAMRKREGFVGKRCRAFVFFGWAAC